MGWLEFCGQVAKREIADDGRPASDIRQLPSSPDCPETAERGGGRIWDSTHPLFSSMSSPCLLSFKRNEAIVGARLRLRGPGCRPGAAAPDVHANPRRAFVWGRGTKINHPSTCPPRVGLWGTLLHRSNPFSTFVNLILICDCAVQRGTLNVSRSNPRRVNRLRVSVPPRYLENPVSSNCQCRGSD